MNSEAGEAMAKKLLAAATTYKRNKQWEQSADFYQQYLEAIDGHGEASVYAHYAATLRILGRASEAKEVLESGRRHHPENEQLLREFHIFFDFTGEWEAARKIAGKLVKLYPNNPDSHFRLGRSESFLKNYAKAKTAYIAGLERKHRMPLRKLMEKIKEGFSEHPQEIHSDYKFIDGKNNLGAFIHSFDDGKKLFTKISIYTNPNNGAGREDGFYRNLCASYLELQEIAPRYADMQIVDKVSYLTMEMIDSAPLAASDHMESIIDVSSKISTVRFNDLDGCYPLPDYVFQFRKGRAISVVHFFTQIHDRQFNEKLFSSIDLIMKQHKYPKSIRAIIKRLETAIMESHLYKYIIPEEHYSLLHGDFAVQNLILDQQNNTIKAIDWTSYTTGPHFIDLARYFSSLLLPYQEVEKLYLKNPAVTLSQIEKIFFLYALILFYFQKLGRKGIETELTEFIVPALDELERLALEFHLTDRSDPMASTESLSEQRLLAAELKAKQLEQKITILEEERKHIKKRLDDTLGSKSWKITAPLRLFTERKNLDNL